MIDRLDRLMRAYDQGMLTAHAFASRLVEGTTARPTADTAARLPPEAVSIIRSAAAEPPDAPWVVVESCCTSDVDAFRAAQQRRLHDWLAGLALWRNFFAPSADEQP